MKVDDLKNPRYQDLNRNDAEISILYCTLAEVYYLIKDRGNKGIESAMSHIETVLPDVKDYNCA